MNKELKVRFRSSMLR